MAWTVKQTAEFRGWLKGLNARQQAKVLAYATALKAKGPQLAFPQSSDVKISRHGGMRELRPTAGEAVLRVFYAFDPERSAVLLIGGDKTGDKRFYERMVPLADDLLDEHLATLKGKKK